ncbi:unnamed protein product [Musa acuminata subsp. malaccensis]|uniref:(wild Malaysian banana) hypothetical protein n=1 Tax=Musa acuminata subsp. malaccensis TaxID=214687 RepID=A0A804L5Z1_MUSAM|nr:unnamed protein product [Musa acuminata subsp. malaccensis]
MYSKCGSLEDAVRVFDHMPVKSVATWNSMITSFGVHGRGKEAVAFSWKWRRQRCCRMESPLWALCKPYSSEEEAGCLR